MVGRARRDADAAGVLVRGFEKAAGRMRIAKAEGKPGEESEPPQLGTVFGLDDPAIWG